MESVLGPENFQLMIMSIDNDAIMGRTKSFRERKHQRKASGQPRKIPNLNSEKLLEDLVAQGSKTNREFDSKGFKHILDELEKNKQNVVDQNKIMDDIQNKMNTFNKEMNIGTSQNQDLNFETNSKSTKLALLKYYRVKWFFSSLFKVLRRIKFKRFENASNDNCKSRCK